MFYSNQVPKLQTNGTQRLKGRPRKKKTVVGLCCTDARRYNVPPQDPHQNVLRADGSLRSPFFQLIHLVVVCAHRLLQRLESGRQAILVHSALQDGCVGARAPKKTEKTKKNEKRTILVTHSSTTTHATAYETSLSLTVSSTTQDTLQFHLLGNQRNRP